MNLLQVEELRKSFDGLIALDGVDLSIDSGECVGLIGPNGAGKTTFFNCTTGVLSPDSGSVRFEGEDILGSSPAKIARRGMIRTFQVARELGEMTVQENMALGAQNQPGETMAGSLLRTSEVLEREQEVIEQADELIEFLGLSHLKEEYAGNLSAGQRKLLGLGRVLMSEPDMILLDEPFAGVNPTLERSIMARVEELNEEGITFLIVEHEIETLVEICDRLIVLHNGRTLLDGDPESVVQDDTVIDAYLGGALPSD